MHKVLIVDDEVFVRKGLINLIDWSSLQFEICGEADNGAQALALIQHLSPDLVIVDIRMPVLDGLELIRQVNAEGGHQPVFIILSGYPDFSYAQQAFRYKVSDYILKPVNEQEMVSTLRRIATTLNQKQLLSMTRDKPLVEIIIESLIQAEPGEQVMTQIAHTLELPLTAAYTYVIVEIQDLLPHREIDYLQPLQHTLRRYFQLEGQTLLIHVRAYNQYGVIVPPSWQAEQFGSARVGYAKLLQGLENHLSTEVALFVGHQVDQLQRIVHSRASADECLKYRFAAGVDGIFMAAELLERPLYYYDVDEELHGKLIYEIEANHKEGYNSAIDAIFMAFKERYFTPGAVANTVRRSMIAMINIIRQLEGNEAELSWLPELLNWQTKYRNLDQLKGIFTRFIEEAAEYIAKQRGEKSNGNIEKVKKYIDGHFRDNIYLKGIAADFHMNPIYLGQLFRKHYGMYFNEYLLTLRIEEAKRLLRQTKKRVYEIAELVGFQNADYFATQFEKLEKTTPSEYRQNMIDHS
ncbi:response regulator transcription factor [Paenibacillus xanthanilyticus]|uniref:Response regulator n=1 Tax=Paenibacillus xanthanilyticus TaxID=1783531 RepID=A0ABV8JZ61_9BACL